MSDQMPLYRRVGVLKSLGGVRTSDSGTNLLELDDGSTILLKSLQINLDDPAYLDKTVEVRGILTYTTDKKQIMDVANIDLVQEDTTSSSQEVNWKDMQNDELGISIKYRDDLKVEDSNGALVFSREFTPNGEAVTQQTADNTATTETAATQAPVTDTSGTGQVDSTVPTIVHRLTISKDTLASGETIYTKAGLKNGEADMLSSGITRSRIGSGSYDALKKVYGDTTTYFVQSGQDVYSITIDAGDDEQTLQDQNMFYEMLNNFKIAAGGVSLMDADKANNSTQASTEETTSKVVKTTQESTVNTQESSSPAAATVLPADSVAGTPTSVLPDTSTVNKVVAPDSATQANDTAVQMDTSSLEGYEKLESDSFKFSMLYPKSWYYSGSAGTESGVIRHYEFGSKPLEDVPGDVSLDLISGSVPSGSSSTINGKEVTVVNSSNGVEIYTKGSGSRIYRFMGPSSEKATLLNMAASIAE